MEFIVADEPGGSTQILFPIKFETKKHFIDLNTIIRTSNGVKETYAGAGIALFGSYDNQIELIYGAAETGSITTWIGKKAKQATIIGSGFAATQFTDGFLENATGKTFRDWGAVAADYAMQLPSYAENLSQTTLDTLTRSLIEADTCKKFLELDEDAFEELISERPDAAQRVQKGRRLFFEACKANEELPSLRFGLTEDSRRIPRRDFPNRTKRQAIAPSKTSLDPLGDWSSEFLTIEVTSPNWDRLDQQRGWKGQVSDGKYIYFHISDTRFWSKVSEKTLITATPDRMKAQVIFKNVAGRYKSAEVIKVVEFNGEPISDALNEQTIGARLSEIKTAYSQIQNPLFLETDD